MRQHRLRLAPKQTERVASLWQLLAGVRPSVCTSISPKCSTQVFVTVTFPHSGKGYRGRFRFRERWYDAPTVAATQLMRAVIAASSPELLPDEECRLFDIVYRFIERGCVTRAALRDVALMASVKDLAVFFAPFCR